ncbi:MAG TPA: hypothetical protein VES73_00855 [Lamprocystis sp. (in: g-proteobacteria)]|nr:hypothetical protein [Lamprocystis sp. (in: g-proteobacteria)]
MSVSPRRPSPVFLLGGLTLAPLLLLGGCAGVATDMATDMGIKSKTPPTIQAELERQPPVTSSGRAAAVLSLHTRKSFTSACKYGLTLTNNLPFKITDLSFRLTAIIDGNVPFDNQTKSFSQLRPSQQQYREITFQGVSCDQIRRIEVSDPGRCTVDALNRFNSNPGDCAKFSDLAPSRLVNIVNVKR